MKLLAILFAFTLAGFSADTLTSGDAYVRFDRAGTAWSCGTSLIEQRLQLVDGKYLLVSLKNRQTGTDFTLDAQSDEFQFTFAGKEYSGRSGQYRLKDYQISQLPTPKASPGIEPGVSLIVNLEHPGFLISLHYDIYASTLRTPMGMIRKWYSVSNSTAQTQPLTDISMNHLRLRNDLGERLTLHYWQGGGSDQGTNELRSEPLAKQRNRTFDSLSGGTRLSVR